MEDQLKDVKKTSQAEDWKTIDQAVQTAFSDWSILTTDRATLEKWMVGLCLGTHIMERDQEPMMRRLEAIQHLVAVRLAQESEQRREEQQEAASAAMRRHNKITRWIAVGGITVAAFSALPNWFSAFRPAAHSAASEKRVTAPSTITNNTSTASHENKPE